MIPYGVYAPLSCQKRHVEAEQAPVVVEADPDVVELTALVRAGDEVLAAVLDPLDLPAERDRRPRHEDLLGPGVHDLDAEPAAHVGRDAPRPGRAAGPAWRRGRRARWSTSGSRCTPAGSRRRRPSARTRPCPPAASMRCARRRGRARARAAPRRSRRGRRRPPGPCGRRRLPGTSSCTRCAAARAASMPTTAGSTS